MSKFNDTTAEKLYEITLNGCADEEIGTADGFGYFARVGSHILVEDEQGFVDYVEYLDATEATRAFATIVTEALKWEEATGVYV
jgi:hypothetical protein